jgi:hypothetical protein
MYKQLDGMVMDVWEKARPFIFSFSFPFGTAS